MTAIFSMHNDVDQPEKSTMDSVASLHIASYELRHSHQP